MIVVAILTTILINLFAAALSKWDIDGGFCISPVENVALFTGAAVAAGLVPSAPYPVLSAAFFLYLLFAAAMDSSIGQVYDFLHLPIFAALMMCFLFSQENIYALIPLSIYAIFLIVQLLFKCYGMADTFVFANCGVYLCVSGSGTPIEELLVYFIALSNVLFFVFNIGNIQIKPFQLKKSSPYIPAIAASLLLLLTI